MEVSQTKSVVTSSTPALGKTIALRVSAETKSDCRPAGQPEGELDSEPEGIPYLGTQLQYEGRVKSLGVGLGAGVRRNATVINKRLKQFRKRIHRFQELRRAGVNTARLIRTGGTAALTHGEHTHGVPPSLL